MLSLAGRISLAFFCISCLASCSQGSTSVLPSTLTVDVLRSTGGQMSGKRVAVVGYLVSVDGETSPTFWLVGNRDYASLPENEMRSLAIRIDAWVGGRWTDCVNSYVKVSGEYVVEAKKDANWFNFDTIEAQIVEQLPAAKLCGTISDEG